ncbi:methyltransferase domain-containing protein [Methylocapsa sp. D3K7]|uniref:methyltransferase domain-containing protein n=1 Tax=Methylocapsa sp. D3K7 TaxID=3041435 RepID=UPI00244ECDBF|nr:methyltransferase domain-containing protein [Methylocapsa sp. D3K7]WGJ14342.1 methyltransferase domain-containing protein [Methylocapsa sp. D3K7]
MHASALKAGQLFFSTYWQSAFTTILDIGSRDVNGTLRQVAPANSKYTGIDLEGGPGVDQVLTDPYSYPFVDGAFDCIVSTSCFEHDRLFWLTFLEACRVTSPDGFIYINAPLGGLYHGYPYDHWRFYPDAGLALEEWGRRMGHSITLVESFNVNKSIDTFQDFTMVFAKRSNFVPQSYIFEIMEGVVNARRGSGGELLKPQPRLL